MINRDWTPASEQLLKSLESREATLSPKTAGLLKALRSRKQTHFPHADQGSLFGGEGVKNSEPHHYEQLGAHKHRVAGAAPVATAPTAATAPVAENKSEKTSPNPLRDSSESRNNIEAAQNEPTKEKNMPKVYEFAHRGNQVVAMRDGQSVADFAQSLPIVERDDFKLQLKKFRKIAEDEHNMETNKAALARFDKLFPTIRSEELRDKAAQLRELWGRPVRIIFVSQLAELCSFEGVVSSLDIETSYNPGGRVELFIDNRKFHLSNIRKIEALSK